MLKARGMKYAAAPIPAQMTVPSRTASTIPLAALKSSSAARTSCGAQCGADWRLASERSGRTSPFFPNDDSPYNHSVSPQALRHAAVREGSLTPLRGHNRRCAGVDPRTPMLDSREPLIRVAADQDREAALLHPGTKRGSSSATCGTWGTQGKLPGVPAGQ